MYMGYGCDKHKQYFLFCRRSAVDSTVLCTAIRRKHNLLSRILFIYSKKEHTPNFSSYLLHSRFHGYPIYTLKYSLFLTHIIIHEHTHLQYWHGKTCEYIWNGKCIFLTARASHIPSTRLPATYIWGVWTFNSSAHQSWCICRHLISLFSSKFGMKRLTSQLPGTVYKFIENS